MNTEEFIRISNNLLSLNELNFDEIEKEVTNSPLLDSKYGLYVYVNFFHQTHRVRRELFDLLTKLFVKICLDKSNPKHQLLPLVLLKMTFASPDPNEFRTRIRTLYFVRRCYDLEFFDKKEFMNLVLQYFDDNPSEVHILDSCFFAPEILKIRPDHFQKIQKRYKNVESTAEYGYFFQNFDKLKADNWKLFYDIIEHQGLRDDIREILRNDDLNALINMTNINPLFDYHQTLPLFLFEPNSMLQRGTNLLHAAAFYGSIQCMKYLIMIGVSPKSKDKEEYNLSLYCVTGGNIEALRIAQQSGTSFLGAAQLAVEYFRFDVLEWIMNEYDKTVWNIDMYGRRRIHNAAISGNIQIMDQIQNDPEDPEDVDIIWQDSTPLSLAIKNDGIATIKYILDHSRATINHLTDQLSIFQAAIISSHDETVLFLLDELPEWDHWQRGLLNINDMMFVMLLKRTNLILPFARKMGVNPTNFAPILAVLVSNHHFRVTPRTKKVLESHPEIFGNVDSLETGDPFAEEEDYDIEEEEFEEEDYGEEEEEEEEGGGADNE